MNNTLLTAPVYHPLAYVYIICIATPIRELCIAGATAQK
jgi:hypothetical protein